MKRLWSSLRATPKIHLWGCWCLKNTSQSETVKEKDKKTSLSEMISENLHTGFQGEMYNTDVYRFVKELLICLGSRNLAQGTQMNHVTTFLAQTAVASICTIYIVHDLFPSSILCSVTENTSRTKKWTSGRPYRKQLKIYAFYFCLPHSYFHVISILCWFDDEINVYPMIPQLHGRWPLICFCLCEVNYITIFINTKCLPLYPNWAEIVN